MTMIERVARAIGAALMARGVIVNFEDDLARAAIEEMREPTEAMAGAPYDANVRILTEAGAEPILDDAAREVWQAMIDAAKAERGAEQT